MGEEVEPANTELMQNPEAEFRHQLEEFLWITQVEIVKHFAGQTALKVWAMVKPLGVSLEDTPVAVRHKVLLSYECVLEIVAKMGGKHISYPELVFTGEVIDQLGTDDQKFITRADLVLELRVA